MLSHVCLFVTPGAVVHQAPLSVEFSRQKYWSGLPFPSPEDLPDLGIEPRSYALQADSSPSEPPGKPVWQGAGGSTGIFFFLFLFSVNVRNYYRQVNLNSQSPSPFS